MRLAVIVVLVLVPAVTSHAAGVDGTTTRPTPISDAVARIQVGLVAPAQGQTVSRFPARRRPSLKKTLIGAAVGGGACYGLNLALGGYTEGSWRYGLACAALGAALGYSIR